MWGHHMVCKLTLKTHTHSVPFFHVSHWNDLAAHCLAHSLPKPMMLSTAPPRLCKPDAVFTLTAGLRLRNEHKVLMGGFHLFFFFLTFWPRHSAHEILVPQPGLKLAAPVVEAQNLNQWATSKVLGGFYLYLLKLRLLFAFISRTFVLKIDCLKYFTKCFVLYFKQGKVGATFQRLAFITPSYPIPFNTAIVSKYPTIWKVLCQIEKLQNQYFLLIISAYSERPSGSSMP